jgi:hypothetical protein
VGKCPQCGAGVPSLTYVCAYCGVAVAPRPPAPGGGDEPVGTRGEPADVLTRAGRLLEDVMGTKLRDEALQVPDSPEELITFFSKHIGGVAFNRHSQHHLHACEGALTKLWAFSSNDPRLARTVAELQVKFDAAKSSQKRLAIGIIAGSILFFLAMFGFVCYMASNQNSRHAAARDEVQKLIRQGRFNEARIRAQELEFKPEIDQMLQAIDRAENSGKQRR